MDLSIAHADVIAATRRGFAFLLANGLGWWVVGVLAFRWPVRRVATLLLFMGAVTMPLAFALRGWLGFPDYDPANPLNALALLIAFAPAVAFPAIVITYLQAPRYLPAVMAALLGGHFLPYAWNELERGGEDFLDAYAVHHWENQRKLRNQPREVI